MSSPATILLVDDDVRNLDVLESVLLSDGYSLVRALTAERALHALLDGDFAVIVLDIQMPEMSGFELANLIKQRKRTQHIPIIFLTAYFQEDRDILAGYGTGAVDYLTKPINPKILKLKIGVFVDLFRKSRALELEIGKRQMAEAALREANAELEKRVEERTMDLVRLNAELQAREKELATARDRAIAASQAKDEFLACLSHELRTPLNPAQLIASDSMANKNLPENVRADFAVIMESITLEARLIDDLLDITRISQGKMSLDLAPMDPKTAIDGAVAMVRTEMDHKGIILHLKLPAEFPPIAGDGLRLRQIFWNVLKNAVKFTPPGGSITVEATADSASRRMAIHISDTGIGLTQAEIERIFEAFSQGDHAGQAAGNRFGGLGLGLAISRVLTQLHGGTIRASSAGRGLGATFTIELPLLLDQKEADTPVLAAV